MNTLGNFRFGFYCFGPFFQPVQNRDGTNYLRKVLLNGQNGFYNLRYLEGKNLAYYSEISDDSLKPALDLWNFFERFKMQKVATEGEATLVVKYLSFSAPKDFSFDFGEKDSVVNGSAKTEMARFQTSKYQNFLVLEKQTVLLSNNLPKELEVPTLMHLFGKISGVGDSDKLGDLMFPNSQMTSFSDRDLLTFQALEAVSGLNILAPSDFETLQSR